MDGQRFRARNPNQGLRQKMLPAVLLHEIESASKVDRPRQRIAERNPRGSAKHMDDGAIGTLEHIDDGHASQNSVIARLASGRRVEASPIQHDRGPRGGRRALEHPRGERCEKRIMSIQAFSHWAAIILGACQAPMNPCPRDSPKSRM